MRYMFYDIPGLNGSITIMNPSVSYTGMFTHSSTNENAEFVVNYVDDNTKTLAERMVATKSSSSNVVLGTLQS